MIFNYERKEHTEYLDNLVKEGTYQEYLNALDEAKSLVRKLENEEFLVGLVVDQADNICYADIMFCSETLQLDDTLQLNAEKIIQLLRKAGIEQDFSCLYFNVPLACFMYTITAIKANDVPNWYSGINGERLIIR